MKLIEYEASVESVAFLAIQNSEKLSTKPPVVPPGYGALGESITAYNRAPLNSLTPTQKVEQETKYSSVCLKLGLVGVILLRELILPVV